MTVPDLLISSVVTVAPPLVAGVLGVWMDTFSLLGIFILASPMMILGLPLGIMAAYWAMAKGWAGWGVALGAGITLAGLFCVILLADHTRHYAEPFDKLFYAVLNYAPVGATYAGLFWLTLYLRRPQAFET